jgi:hypothetical protein
LRIEPDPRPEEIAAIMVAIEIVSEDLREPEEAAAQRRRSRWRLAGLLGHVPPREIKLEGSLWSYSSWGGMV